MASNPDRPKIWCDEDSHRKYEDYADFNEWFDGDDGTSLRKDLDYYLVAKPSKAFFAGDREAYDQALGEYWIEQRNEWLGSEHLSQICGDEHWSQRNAQRFDQLCARIENGDVVPFIGAGISQPGGFPTWKTHLRDQWRTAGLAQPEVEDLLSNGQYETIVDRIENEGGRDVFHQELRDAFDRNGEIPPTLYLTSELFRDTVITTNYDRLIEQSYDIGDNAIVQMLVPAEILTPPDADKTTVIKLHGDIRTPAGCILSKNQYDQAYGDDKIDLSLPIPQGLDYYFRNSSLLFLGCSLNQDRTTHVFEAIKAAANDDGINLPQHFSIEQCPTDQEQMAARNAELLGLGITPIWFEQGCFDYIEGILRLIRNELRHRKA